MTSNFTRRWIPKRNKSICPRKNFCMDIHGSITHNNQKVETTQMSISWLMDKQNVAYRHSGIFGNKKEWSTSYNMNYAKWKKPVAKDHTWYDFIYMKCPDRHVYRDRKSVSGCQGLGEREWEWLLIGSGFFLERWKCSQVDCETDAQLCEYTKIHWIAHFKWVNFTECKLHITCMMHINKAVTK